MVDRSLKITPVSPVSSGSGNYKVDLGTSAVADVIVVDLQPYKAKKQEDERSIENAVYTYIRAVRALGRTTINTLDIANALSLPVGQVNQVVQYLKTKGVKILNP